MSKHRKISPSVLLGVIGISGRPASGAHYIKHRAGYRASAVDSNGLREWAGQNSTAIYHVGGWATQIQNYTVSSAARVKGVTTVGVTASLSKEF